MKTSAVGCNCLLTVTSVHSQLLILQGGVVTTQGFAFSTSRLGPGRTGEGGGAGWLYCHLLWPGHDTQHSRGLALTHNSPRLFAVFLACNSCIRSESQISQEDLSFLSSAGYNLSERSRWWQSLICHSQQTEQTHLSRPFGTRESLCVYQCNQYSVILMWASDSVQPSPQLPSLHLSLHPAGPVSSGQVSAWRGVSSLTNSRTEILGRGESYLSTSKKRRNVRMKWPLAPKYCVEEAVQCSSWHCYCLFSLRASWGNE